MPLFEVIDLFIDETSRGGFEQMALDEALLEGVQRPLLRAYLWAEPTVTFGYSQSLVAVRKQCPSGPCVRRWTGGGLVEHGRDWTFSLIVPQDEPLARARPEETYRLLHARIVAALKELGCPARLAQPEENIRGLACFSTPAAHDVLGPDQRKLCGGAQRRTRQGFLHQGSIQSVPLPADFAVRLLSLMAARTLPSSPSAATLMRAQELVVQKYATIQWLERVP